MRVCVFCGSSPGHESIYAEATAALGRSIVRRGGGVVYGGGKVGLMGIVADAAMAAGGEVTGVIPRYLAEKEIAHESLSALEVVSSMHERKARMAELSDAFVALPGGAGTLEEIVEQWTWAQLGFHAKPCAFLDVDGYFAPLREMVCAMVERGFLKPAHADMLVFTDDVEALLDACASYEPPDAPKWTVPPSAKP